MATMAKTNSTSTAEDMEWPVHVYRKTEQGWQKMQPKNASGQNVFVIKATPRRNSIVLHRIQVRVRLRSDNKRDGDSATRTSVVRRRDCLLITSSQRMRALALKFRTVKACLEFSDRLMALNPPPEKAVLEKKTEAVKKTRDHGTASDSRQLLSYVGRLLHDEDFADMVDNLEECISSSEDGARMLEALINNNNDQDDDDDANSSNSNNIDG